jgi:hypothetical protein
VERTPPPNTCRVTMKDREVDEKERRESRLERMRIVMNHPVLGPKMRAVISRRHHEKKTNNKEGGKL